ncbi:hypothetical protein HU200_025428 [Digitaria exilis]|uniref:DUF7887 domain-containing protein n=1 Tax=Digitaria exilis TaxID=1010633 RepID=A0A835EV13_9POAL|nr:hypothetical protein HU200_025428 [Digitaria exilis]CAB3501634.1 unnamed protein product [Digitaria exilis]
MLRCHVGAGTVAPVPHACTPALPLAHRLAPRPAARGRLRPCSCRAKKPEANEDGRAGGSVLSKSVLLRSGVALFALGFVDAGYSGDWSRIGAISKDTEELLKLGAYVVVPLCVALVFSLSEDSNNKP